jgi:CDP-6-deoxy-D-xylo-4-hexulose-3-dehydrase
MLKEHNIDCRPIVTGNFVKNKSVLKYFDYEIHNELNNADYIDQNGLFVGNHHINITKEIEYLYDVINKL